MQVPVTLKVSAFALLVMGVYTYYANSIPQLQSKPPVELSLEGGNVTPEQLVKAGEEIFKGKGTGDLTGSARRDAGARHGRDRGQRRQEEARDERHRLPDRIAA
jgi:hypothetical protein